MTIQAWFGCCKLPTEWHPVFAGHVTPPAFHKYGRSFELSLAPDFGASFICGHKNRLEAMAEHPHDGYDFHWLRLPLYQNLRTVKIWISARSKSHRRDPKEIVLGIKELGVAALTKSLSAFQGVASVAISTPLGPSFLPAQGLMESFALPNVALHKRGLGDRFHPWLNLFGDTLQSYHNNLIHTCYIGYVCTRSLAGSIYSC
jgi:hypothetical protein